jgi:hypothetical protein
LKSLPRRRRKTYQKNMNTQEAVVEKKEGTNLRSAIINIKKIEKNRRNKKNKKDIDLVVILMKKERKSVLDLDKQDSSAFKSKNNKKNLVQK